LKKGDLGGFENLQGERIFGKRYIMLDREESGREAWSLAAGFSLTTPKRSLKDG
jgi:hypothetical protein